MHPATANVRAAEWASTGSKEHKSELQRELAKSIHGHFGALATALDRAATLGVGSADHERLRAATAAAIRGQETARQLMAVLAA